MLFKKKSLKKVPKLVIILIWYLSGWFIKDKTKNVKVINSYICAWIIKLNKKSKSSFYKLLIRIYSFTYKWEFNKLKIIIAFSKF